MTHRRTRRRSTVLRKRATTQKPAVSVTIIGPTRRRGGGGGTPTPTPTPTPIPTQKPAVSVTIVGPTRSIRAQVINRARARQAKIDISAFRAREELRLKAKERRRGFTRLEAERFLKKRLGPRAIRILREATRRDIIIAKRTGISLREQIEKKTEELKPTRLPSQIKRTLVSKQSKILKKPILRISKDVGRARRQKIKTFFTKESISKLIGFSKYRKEANKSSDKIFKEVSNFADSRLAFYQAKVNDGSISVSEADKKIEQEVNKKQNDLINKNQFFRSENPRKPTTNSVSFNYETDRLKAIKEGNNVQANTFLFLRMVTETPSSLVRLGLDAKKGITELINNPKVRETSIKNIKNIFSIKKAKGLPRKIEIKANELTNFVLTSPGTALAVVGGNVVSFALVSGAIGKIGKPVLKVTGIVSKNTSKIIIKNLKFNPFIKKGLKNIGKISIEISPKIFKEVGRVTRTGRGLAISSRATKKFIKSFNKIVEKSKIGTRARKISGGLSKERRRIRIRKLIRRIRNLRFVKRIRFKVKKFTVAKEKRIFKKRLKKRREEKILRRKKLLKKERKKSRISKLKKVKLVVAVRRTREKIRTTIKAKIKALKERPFIKKIKRIKLELKLKKERKILLKRVFQRRREKIKRRARLSRQERFKKSKLGRLKIGVSKKIRKLDSIIKKFETPSARLVFPRAKTSLSRTFPREFKLKINDRAVEKFVKKQVELRGINFNKLSGIQKNFLIGQVKARIRTQPGRFISKSRKRALKRFRERERKRLRKVGRQRIKIAKQREIIITRLKPTRPPREIPSAARGRQILLQRPKLKLKEPKQIIQRFRIVSAELTKIQKLSLKRLKNIQTKQKVVQKQINRLKQKQFSRKRQATKGQKLKIKQRIRFKSKQLEKLVSRLSSLFNQLQPQLQRLGIRQTQPPRVTPKQAQPLALSSREIQAQRIIQPLRIKIKTIPKVPPKRLFGIPIIKRRRGKGVKKSRKPVKSFNVFARPLKKRGQKRRPKLIKINKTPLSKVRAEDLRNFIADQSLSRTARIKPTKGKPRQPRLRVPKGYARRTSRKFRRHRIVRGKRIALAKGKIIELRKHILDTRSEKLGISLRRKIAQLERKAGIRKPIKRKGVKRVITQNQRRELLKRLVKARAVRMRNLKRR